MEMEAQGCIRTDDSAEHDRTGIKKRRGCTAAADKRKGDCATITVVAVVHLDNLRHAAQDAVHRAVSTILVVEATCCGRSRG